MNIKKQWIQKAITPSSKGKLHKALGIPLDQTIPGDVLLKAMNSSNPRIAKMANLANTLKKIRKGK